MTNDERRIAHSWDVTPAEAIRIQQEVIRPAVRVRRLRRSVRLVGGADCAFDARRPEQGSASFSGRKSDGRAFAAWVVWDMEAGQVVERAWAEVPLRFPYVPGLLTFREGPALLAAWRKLSVQPDVAMFDGVGLAHPRRCGLACHMGVLLDIPSLGVAKSRLCGVAGEPGPGRGSVADLLDEDEVIGKVVRTRERVRPVFVSVGHRITLADAVRLTLACCTRYRLPEPTRLADQLVGRIKRGNE